MKKRVLLIVLGLLVLIGILAAIKVLQIRTMIAQGKNMIPPPETVTATAAKKESWESVLSAVGALTAVQGVTVSAELAGKVAKIHFQPGSSVRKGEILLVQDISSEEAQLPGAVAQADLARNNLRRAEQLLADGIISQADHESSSATYRQAQAQADAIRATIAKKTIRAPFAGNLGIRQVNLGQSLAEGAPIVTLQTQDPIFVDFTLPQQQIGNLASGLAVRVTGDPLPGAMHGRITTVNPQVESDSRMLKVQATLANPAGRLRPGMFVNVTVELPGRQQVLVIPATSVLFAPYGDSVFIIEQQKEGNKGLALRQQFVRLGEKRGDFVAVTSGLKEGESVVSTGVFKLRNSQPVVIDNKLSPQFQQTPQPENS